MPEFPFLESGIFDELLEIEDIEDVTYRLRQLQGFYASADSAGMAIIFCLL